MKYWRMFIHWLNRHKFNESVRKSLELSPELFKHYQRTMASPVTPELDAWLRTHDVGCRDMFVWQIARFVENEHRKSELLHKMIQED